MKNTPQNRIATSLKAVGYNKAAAEFKDKLTKFQAKFGAENGAKWAADGLTYVEALEKHADVLKAEHTALKAETAELETRLSAISTQN